MSYTHEHKYFIYQVKNNFEPTIILDQDGRTLYIMVEYAFSSCNCGDTIKKEVRLKEDAETN